MKSRLVQLVPMLLVPMLLVASGCGRGDDSEVHVPLCDPLDATAGRIALEARTPREEPGRAVLYDNGAYFLFVDDQCNYWVKSPSRIWGETRSGVLDVETAGRLGESLRFSAWSEVSGTWSDSRGGVFDADVLIFDDAKRAVVCADSCDSPDVPAVVKVMRDAFPIVAHELWDRGTPIVSGVRAIAVAGELGPGIPFVDWPLVRPISDFVRTGDAGIGKGVLEDDVASVQALKELRASFVRGDHGAFVWDMLPVKSDGAYYRLYLRDALPFEDARGLVPLTVQLDP